MRVIIPSIGRCGSTLICNLIAEARECASGFTDDIHNPPRTGVIKTHVHFDREPVYAYRAVFVWGNVGDIIASLALRTDNTSHLQHLQVDPAHIARYQELDQHDRMAALEYLVEDDKFRFIENVESWTGATHVILVQYETLCAYPVSEAQRIADFVGVSLSVPSIIKRLGDATQLPFSLQRAIINNYPDYMR